MPYLLEVKKPNGEMKLISLGKEFHIGNQPCDHYQLYSSHSNQCSVRITYREQLKDYWIEVISGGDLYLNDIQVQSSKLPINSTFQIEQTQFKLIKEKQKKEVPKTPTGVKAWQTNHPLGVKLLWNCKKLAMTPLSIYLNGETGTGKEILAHLIHKWSERATGPFVAINCGALPLSLVESELFGHTKGSFTGAESARAGALLQAHGGTLFLDEVADLPLEVQVKLLRFLENGEIRPVGSERTFHANVRVICATHQSLEKLIVEKKFRQDLYYRLASVTIEIPTLTERPEDIELIANQIADSLGKTISERSMYRLKSYHWPGNVRELRHAIERAAGMAGPFQIILQERDFDFLCHQKININCEENPTNALLTLKEVEKEMLLKVLKITGGNRNKSAELLGVARSTLFAMLKRHQITKNNVAA